MLDFPAATAVSTTTASQKVAVDHLGSMAHAVAGAAIRSCNRSIVNHNLAIGKCYRRLRALQASHLLLSYPHVRAWNLSNRDGMELQDVCPNPAYKKLLCSNAERLQGCCKGFVRWCESQ